MKVAMISDVHEQWEDLVIPECDLLISAGDYSYMGKAHVVTAFHSWLSKQPAKHIISVQGNHELWVEKNFEQATRLVPENIYFIDEGLLDVDGWKIWCSAVTPWFHNWAWNVQNGEDIKKHWDKIPDDTEILITHGPPHGILDQINPNAKESSNELHSVAAHLGCPELFLRVGCLEYLKLHVFGHIHGSSGEKTLNGVRFINAAICDENYKPTNPVREYVLVK